MKRQTLWYVYTITCISNERVYVGTSSMPNYRCLAHESCLDSNTHRNRSLQSDFNKYGTDQFEFEVCFEFSKRYKAFAMERFLIRRLWLMLYNKKGRGLTHDYYPSKSVDRIDEALDRIYDKS